MLNIIFNELLPDSSQTGYRIIHRRLYENNIFVNRNGSRRIKVTKSMEFHLGKLISFINEKIELSVQIICGI